jgi:hypothetical protein
MVKIESKEKLAKLLAMEDLDIQHQQVPTAMFDIKNRCLILPIWKDMPNHLYDLLVGHEVGHALFTPTNPDRLKKIIDKTSKDCVNIIEDARIEALIKRRYPGLKKQFFNGYNNLIERDFFGLKKININESSFLDRLNIFFKIPQYGDIVFNKDEQKIVERIQKSKSFKDVEEIAVDVYSFIKKHDKKEDSDTAEEVEFDDVDGTGENEIFDSQSQDEGESIDSESTDGESTDEEKDENSNSNSNSNKDELTEEEQDQNSFDKFMNEENNKTIPDDKELQEKDIDKVSEKEVFSKTQRHFEERLKKEYVDDKSKNRYINVPDNINMKNAVVDYKEVHRNINEFYSTYNEHWNYCYWDETRFNALKKVIYKNAKQTLQKLKKESVKTVNHIAMEFERKKAADVYKKTLITKTGVLDTNKLFSAKYNEDVFKKSVRVPDGKSHGLVMIIDWSGSMATNISDCIKQLIELTFFCKKVNIPFEVYSFSDAMTRYDTSGKETGKMAFDYRHNDFVCDSRVQLRNYLSSRMSAKEYNNALLNLCIFSNRFGHPINSSFPSPKADELCSTPLNGAILVSEYVIRNFKKKNNLENVHAVWLTDGEGNGRSSSWDVTKNRAVSTYNSDYSNNIFLKDKKTKKNYLISGRGMRAITPQLFDIIKERLGINIIGFYILPSFTTNNLWRFVPKNTDPNKSYIESQQDFRTWMKETKKVGHFIKTESGYDEYYVMCSKIDNKPIGEIDEKMTTRKMVNLFSKKNNQFKSKRVILSRFVDLITASK